MNLRNIAGVSFAMKKQLPKSPFPGKRLDCNVFLTLIVSVQELQFTCFHQSIFHSGQ